MGRLGVYVKGKEIQDLDHLVMVYPCLFNDLLSKCVHSKLLISFSLSYGSFLHVAVASTIV